MKKFLEMFAEISEKEDGHTKLCKQFGNCLKLGIFQNSTIRTRVVKLLRFKSLVII